MLFHVDTKADKLTKERSDSFHTSIIMKLLLVVKRARMDLLMAISFLSTSMLAKSTLEDERKLS